jgi:hypothetical protein
MNNYDFSSRFMDFVCGGGKLPSLLNGYMDEEKMQQIALVIEGAKKHPKHSQINLMAFLILPIQRLPRYRLLLSSLLKETAESHPDHAAVKKAANDVQMLIEFCNETKRECETKWQSFQVMGKINVMGSVRLLHSYVPCPDRELLYQSDSFFIVKYVDHIESQPILNPLLLCKNKKSQFQYAQKGTIKEWKFKLNRDSNQAKVARMIEEGGAASKYDVPNIQGKKCILHVCNDAIFISNSSNQLSGLVHINVHTNASCLPLIVSREAREGVMRLSNGEGILYIRGSLESVAHLVALVNSLL